MTGFGLHTPHSLFDGGDPDAMRDRLTDSVLTSLNSVLAEPIQDVLMSDAHGMPCIETTKCRTPANARTAGRIENNKTDQKRTRKGDFQIAPAAWKPPLLGAFSSIFNARAAIVAAAARCRLRLLLRELVLR